MNTSQIKIPEISILNRVGGTQVCRRRPKLVQLSTKDNEAHNLLTCRYSDEGAVAWEVHDAPCYNSESSLTSVYSKHDLPLINDLGKSEALRSRTARASAGTSGYALRQTPRVRFMRRSTSSPAVCNIWWTTGNRRRTDLSCFMVLWALICSLRLERENGDQTYSALILRLTIVDGNYAMSELDQPPINGHKISNGFWDALAQQPGRNHTLVWIVLFGWSRI